MSNLVKHAEHELSLIGDGECEMQQAMNKHLVEMVKVFAEEGHSGFSAGYAVSLLEKLLRYEPLTPLTGEDDEWVDVGHCFQNKRCSHVLKDYDGKAYDINGKIFKQPDGVCYTGSGSRVAVEFPYMPKSEYVDVPYPEDHPDHQPTNGG